MNRPLRFLILSILPLLIAAGFNLPASHAQTVEASISADSLAAGDRFRLSITLNRDQQYAQIIFPDSTYFKEDIELRSLEHFQQTDFKDSLSYQLQFWGVDDSRIPALPVKLVSASDTVIVYTEAIPITFRSVLSEKDPALRPLKPIFDFAAAWWPYLLGFLLLLIIAALIYYYYNKEDETEADEPRPEFKPEPFLNPLRELENSLRQLEDVNLATEKQFEAYYISLGDAIRCYFERMYDIPAMESTSREIIQALKERAIDERLVKQTRLVLREADMVKFAKFTPTKEQASTAYQEGVGFLAVARDLHTARVQQLQRQHIARMEEYRKAFEQENEEADL